MTDDNATLAEPAEDAPLPALRSGADLTSPVDLPLPEDETSEPNPVRWAAIAIATATGFLALFNASALQSWAFGLTPSAETQPVVAAASGWYQRTAAIGLDAPYRVMHEAWQGLIAIEFSGSVDAPRSDAEDIAPPPPTTAEDAEQASEPGFSGL